jgi:hypothetical protein
MSPRDFDLKNPVVGTKLIRIAGLFDSIVALSALATDFFNSIGRSATPSFAVGTAGLAPIAAVPGGDRGFRVGPRCGHLAERQRPASSRIDVDAGRHNRHSDDAVEAFLAVALNRDRDMRD